MFAHSFKDFGGEFMSDTLFVDVAVKAGFEGVTVLDVELPPEDNAGRFFFRALEVEFAREVAEFVGFLREKLGEDPHSEVAIVVEGVVGPIDEDVFLPRVPMHVEKGEDSSVRVDSLLLSLGIGYLGDELLYGADCRMKLLIRIVILPVKIISCHICSVIPYDNSIRVSHRYDLKDTPFP